MSGVVKKTSKYDFMLDMLKSVCLQKQKRNAVLINYGNWTKWSAIWSKIIRVISILKSSVKISVERNKAKTFLIQFDWLFYFCLLSLAEKKRCDLEPKIVRFVNKSHNQIAGITCDFKMDVINNDHTFTKMIISKGAQVEHILSCQI